MAYHPFYSSFTPFSSTIPPLSPNPYGYGYSSHYNHDQQPLLPYSQPQPPPYSPYTPPYSNPYTPLASLYSQSQPPPPSSPPFPYSQPQPPPLPYHSTCTPPPNPIEATILALTVKLDSIAGEISSLKTQHSSPNTQPPPQKPDSDSLPSIEASSFNGDSVEQFIVADRFVVHGTPPPPAVHLGTEAITSPTKWKSIKTTEVDKQSTISALKSPPLEPSESEKFRGRNGSSSTFESSFIRGLAAIFPSEPLDKEPPDKEPPPAAPKTPDPSPQRLPVESQITGEPIMPPPTPKPPDRKWDQPQLLDHHRPTKDPYVPFITSQPRDTVSAPPLRSPPPKPQDQSSQKLPVASQIPCEPTGPLPEPPDWKVSIVVAEMLPTHPKCHSTFFLSPPLDFLDLGKTSSNPFGPSGFSYRCHAQLGSSTTRQPRELDSVLGSSPAVTHNPPHTPSPPCDLLKLANEKSGPLQESRICVIVLNDPAASNNVTVVSHVKPCPLDQHLDSTDKSHPLIKSTIRVNSFSPPTVRHQFRQWDPGKFIQESNFYNLEDKVGLDGVWNVRNNVRNNRTKE